MNTALRIVENPIDRLLSRLESARRAGTGYTAKCPAHSDRCASLSVSEADGGKVLLHCFAGCPTADILTAAGLTLADLFPAPLRAFTPEERKAARFWRASLELERRAVRLGA